MPSRAWAGGRLGPAPVAPLGLWLEAWSPAARPLLGVGFSSAPGRQAWEAQTGLRGPLCVPRPRCTCAGRRPGRRLWAGSASALVQGVQLPQLASIGVSVGAYGAPDAPPEASDLVRVRQKCQLRQRPGCLLWSWVGLLPRWQPSSSSRWPRSPPGPCDSIPVVCRAHITCSLSVLFSTGISASFQPPSVSDRPN